MSFLTYVTTDDVAMMRVALALFIIHSVYASKLHQWHCVTADLSAKSWVGSTRS